MLSVIPLKTVSSGFGLLSFLDLKIDLLLFKILEKTQYTWLKIGKNYKIGNKLNEIHFLENLKNRLYFISSIIITPVETQVINQIFNFSV